VFLATGCLNGRFVNGQPCLRRAEVGELAARGVTFGSHTVSHPRLVHLGQSDIDKELLRSRQDIEQITGAPATLFSYPYRFPEEDAAFTARLADRLKRNGYEGGVTTSIGSASASDHPLFLKRLPVNDDDDAELFRAKLEGDYDWLHGVQLASKRWRQWTNGHRAA
jgi:peptidoglycan/xylan/chitin deacetylase (PgdA/CDA1 family)